MKALRKVIGDYLQLRRGLGYKLEIDERHLHRFADFLENQKATRITTQLAMAFATENPRLGRGGRISRMCTIRAFARYWNGIDPSSEIPPTGLLRSPRKRAKPRLCSGRQIIRLLEAARRGKMTQTRGLRPWTLYALFGLLAVTGMRVSEAVNLRSDDVDWREAYLTIRDTKFGKSRRVPLHRSTLQTLRRYAHRRDRFLRSGWRRSSVCQTTGLFFVSNRGTALHGGYLRSSFRELQRKAGLAAPGALRVRIHDLRHRFAVETLRRWYERSVPNLEARLPVLSTFLGHVNVASTYWYLSSTPALRAAAIGRVESRWKGVTHVTEK
jgi:integrase/recombinase XerD